MGGNNELEISPKSHWDGGYEIYLRKWDVFVFHPLLIAQRGPTTFDLRAILQTRNNPLVTSNKMMYKTTGSQHLKLKTGR